MFIVIPGPIPVPVLDPVLDRSLDQPRLYILEVVEDRVSVTSNLSESSVPRAIAGQSNTILPKPKRFLL